MCNFLTFLVSLCAVELFSDVQPFVQSAFDGYNVAIFAYGQEHSGKTHTMVSHSSLYCCFPFLFICFFYTMYTFLLFMCSEKLPILKF